MIQFNFDLINSVQNYLLCAAGIWVAIALIKRSDPNVLQKPFTWKVLFLINLLAILPISISVIIDTHYPLPSNWLSPISQSAPAQSMADTAPFHTAINMQLVFGMIYLVGFGLFGWRLGLKLKHLYRFIDQSKAFQPNSVSNNLKNRSVETTLFSDEQLAFIKKHKVDIKISSEPISPFAFGLFQKTMVLPAYVFELPHDKAKLLIAHELCHIKHRDPTILIIMHILCCLFWFNPMNWRYLKYMNLAMELRVDQEITRSSTVEPKLYAQTLLDVMKHSLIALPSAMMTQSVNTNQKIQIKQRITTIMTQSKLSRRKNVKSMACWSLMMLSWPIVMLSVEAKSGNTKPWQYPLETTVKKINSKFKSIDSFRNNKPHLGVDLKAALGTNIVAPAIGTVVIADDTTMHKNYGKVVVILHANGLRSFYAHLQDFNVNVGDTVQAGDILGQVGVTGKTTGPHLHMEVVLDHTHLDPMNFIDIAE
jgi:beta-lactamase regulating signal transducer with metallopeptidase domain